MKIMLLAAALLFLGGCVMPPEYVRSDAGYYAAPTGYYAESDYDNGYYDGSGYYDDGGYYGGYGEGYDEGDCVNCGSLSIGVGYGYPSYGYGGYGYGGYGYGGYGYGRGRYPHSGGHHDHGHGEHGGHWSHGGSDHGDSDHGSHGHWTGGHDGHSDWTGGAHGNGGQVRRDPDVHGNHRGPTWAPRARDPAVNRP